MKELTYIEALEHVRKYKTFIRVGAIADALKMNQGQLRLIINKTGYTHNLPERYRKDFIRIVQMLVNVEQVAGERNDNINMLFSDDEMQ